MVRKIKHTTKKHVNKYISGEEDIDVWGLKPISLKAKIFDIRSGSKIVILNTDTATSNDIYPSSRVLLRKGRNKIVATVDLSSDIVDPDEIGVFSEVKAALKLSDGNEINLFHLPRPASIRYIKDKMDNKQLSHEQIQTIVDDTMAGMLSDIELSAFMTSVYIRDLNDEETVSMTDAIVSSGDVLDLKKRVVLDKHCIGGVNGRVTMILVPIIAASGCYIPKTSSRSITSASGTADAMEVLANVDFNIEEFKRIVLKTHGAVVWGGGMNLAAVDDKYIRIRHPLNLDPHGMLLASILAKKKSVNATHVIIDIPFGRGAKIEDMSRAESLAHDFIRIGKQLNMKIEALITNGSDPIGNAFGPALETIDVLHVLEGNGSIDLKEKSCILAGRLLEMAGKAKTGQGYEIAEKIIDSGKALKKFKEIIDAQGGNPKITSDKIPVGEYTYEVLANKSGRVSHVDNRTFANIAKAAGAPRDKGAGVVLFCEHGDKVKKGEPLFRIHSESESKLDFAIKTLNVWKPIELEKVVITRIRGE
ncbi:AMP phosphorylase [Candidatus Micrarchaeota archaeon]|nr:AMP phosphorylase [Candidatus Micrarchaeota archaeon]